MLQRKAASQELLDLTSALLQDTYLQAFRLVGGTALALQLGHRKSIDIDLFSDSTFDGVQLSAHLQKYYSPTQIQGDRGIVMARINGIKVDFIAHQYPWIDAPFESEGFRMATLKEIAAMKLNAINGSGTRQKDFVDMYYLLSFISLNDMGKAYGQKYPHSLVSIAKLSIREFDRMSQDKGIELLDKKISWEKIKERLQQAVLFPDKIFSQKLLQKKRNSPGNRLQL